MEIPELVFVSHANHVCVPMAQPALFNMQIPAPMILTIRKSVVIVILGIQVNLIYFVGFPLPIFSVGSFSHRVHLEAS